MIVVVITTHNEGAALAIVRGSGFGQYGADLPDGLRLDQLPEGA